MRQGELSLVLEPSLKQVSGDVAVVIVIDILPQGSSFFMSHNWWSLFWLLGFFSFLLAALGSELLGGYSASQVNHELELTPP